MTTFQRVVKTAAIVLAIFIIVGIFVGAAELVFDIVGISNNILDEAETYSLSADIDELDIEISSADFTVKSGDAFSVESNIDGLTVKEENGTLVIEEYHSFLNLGSSEGRMLTLVIPTTAVFERVEISAGAGRFTVEALTAEELSIEFGAGEAKIENLTATKKADIEGGAGRVEINGGSLTDLRLEMGVGSLYIKSQLVGKSELELGVGSTDVDLIGSKDGYTIDVSRGLGRVTLDGEAYGSDSVVGSGASKVYVEGGIGAVNLKFVEA